MALTLEQQIFEQIGKAKKILIALPQAAHVDTFSSALALQLFLQKLEKEVDIISAAAAPDELKFLATVKNIQASLANDKSLVVSLNIKDKPLAEISYHTENGRVNIYLKAQTQVFTPADISFTTERSPYDVIFILGAKSLEDLGEVFARDADIFYEAVKINIDNHANNEGFGAINFLDLTATSVAEILTGLFEKFETQLIDSEIATALLAGIIAKTDSFQHSQTTPRTFLVASSLINLGARQQEVVKFLYKTKPLPFLKLWGRALARINVKAESSLLYSLLNSGDFARAEADDAEGRNSQAVLKALADNLDGYNIVAVISQQGSAEVKILLAVQPQVPVEKLLQKLGGQGQPSEPLVGSYSFNIVSFNNLTLAQAESLLVDAAASLKI